MYEWLVCFSVQVMIFLSQRVNTSRWSSLLAAMPTSSVSQQELSSQIVKSFFNTGDINKRVLHEISTFSTILMADGMFSSF